MFVAKKAGRDQEVAVVIRGTFKEEKLMVAPKETRYLQVVVNATWSLGRFNCSGIGTNYKSIGIKDYLQF